MFYPRPHLDDRTGRSKPRSERELLRATAHTESGEKPLAGIRLCCVFLAFAAGCAFARADSITFSGTIDGESQSAEVTLLPRGTATYISLTELIRTFGGKTTLQPDRVQVDLSGGQAWLKLNQTSVNSSLDSFDLRQPVLREGDDILVAATDVMPMLMKAFGVDVEQRVNREEAPRTSPLGMTVSELTGTAPTTPSRTPARKPKPIKTEIRLAVIDPGHGGDDSGVEASEEAKEKDIALAVALRVRSALEKAYGMQVRLSRDEDLRLSAPQRVRLANRDNGDILISLHTGASRAPAAQGMALFYSEPQPGLDAAAIAQSIANALVESTGTACHGVRQAPLSLFRELEMPGILIEMGFLTNPADVTLLADEAYQQQVADGIAAGIAPFVAKAAAPETAS